MGPSTKSTEGDEPLVSPGLTEQLSVYRRGFRLSIAAAGVLLLVGVSIAVWGAFSFDASSTGLAGFGGFLAGTTGALWSAAGLFLIFAAFLGQLRQSENQEEELRLSRMEIRQTQVELRGQKEQLAEQSRTFRQQRFESTFFQLLTLHHQIVNGIQRTEQPAGPSEVLSPGSAERLQEAFHGRHVFVRIYLDLRRAYERFAERHGTPGLDALLGEVYEAVYRNNQSDLGHYFRNLYTLIKFVRSSDVDDKQMYVNIVRAQLSSHELLLLFYNGLSRYGSEKFKPLLEEFRVFNNMPDRMLLAPEHRAAYSPTAFGDAISRPEAE